MLKRRRLTLGAASTGWLCARSPFFVDNGAVVSFFVSRDFNGEKLDPQREDDVVRSVAFGRFGAQQCSEIIIRHGFLELVAPFVPLLFIILLQISSV